MDARQGAQTSELAASISSVCVCVCASQNHGLVGPLVAEASQYPSQQPLTIDWSPSFFATLPSSGTTVGWLHWGAAPRRPQTECNPEKQSRAHRDDDDAKTRHIRPRPRVPADRGTAQLPPGLHAGTPAHKQHVSTARLPCPFWASLDQKSVFACNLGKS